MSDQERTDDGRYIIVKGQKWRASDPAIPEGLRAELVKELMTARRLVKTRGDEVRFRVHDAKVALGERGEPWWAPTDDGRSERIAATIRSLLRHRDGSSICPSDAARVVGGENWRELMAQVRQVAGALSSQGQISITQKGQPVAVDARGPIRLGPGEHLHS
ncbi:DUF3253 domain-containing protein [Nesterenkonia haasae]|uniref:DUF3253 domain-containing protein n=1 Tax=Nesterenkonia haasae TaxID=2587813 RepID=UPI0013914388|nr:DUF3253 domain-containing protein [Nesterenkonia haasae]NDK32487.1 DUF3253 domain-containing protein [Nesterenkonia haasae]